MKEFLFQLAGVLIVALLELQLRVRGKWRRSALRSWVIKWRAR